jgi:hypothetical protein
VTIDPEDATPSLLEGLARYRWRVLVAVVVAALLGATYAFAAWKPQATTSVGVQVVTNAGTASGNGDRATAEVAANLSTPEVISVAEEMSGEDITELTATAPPGSTVITVTVTSTSVEAAEAAAGTIVDAYTRVEREDRAAAIQPQIGALQASLSDTEAERQAVLGQLVAVGPNSPEANELVNRAGKLSDRVTNISGQLDDFQLSLTAQPVTLVVSSAPAPGPSKMSLVARYVPAAIVGALVLALLAVAVAARRKPWLTSPEVAASLLGAPLLATATSRRAAKLRRDAAPVVALSLRRGLAHDERRLVAFVPTGVADDTRVTRDLGRSTVRLAEEVSGVLAGSGYKVATLRLATTGRIDVMAPDHSVQALDARWADVAGGPFGRTLDGLEAVGVDADVILCIPSAGVEPELVLDLLVRSDAVVPVVAPGMPLSSLLDFEREARALDLEVFGVVSVPKVS